VTAGITIRLAGEADAATLAALSIEVWLDTYATDGVEPVLAEYALAEFTAARFAWEVTDPARLVLVAEKRGGLVGLAVAHLDAVWPEAPEHDALLKRLYVQSHHKRQGIGEALLAAATAHMADAGRHGVWLTAYWGNEAAHAFYRRQGFARIGTDMFHLGEERHENYVWGKRFA
jgi:ribosomal protein S18 acetylase RimI-like enzyme